ncbi:LysR family transcriptional regulator [Ruegeria sediminis]|uniref:LysR family transcriptional regulator n=1 Tax=Ruegeria sediminis TaxID=2583820 RepID=A0ABY2X4W9_9RHOB|nr:LysR family transcriptional regulator [Ruegeria sediminis]TMV10094.1 LysR family transcriptional regulator [Ruegeria sediminis]
MNDRFYSCAKALVATVRAGSMSAAAAELKTTKSAISQKIALFEAELGLTLLDRSGRAVTPTAAGRRIFGICVGPVDVALEAEAELGLARGDAIAGRVSISGPNSLLGVVFIPMMPGLRDRYPDIELELRADDSRSDFATDDIDLAFRTGAVAKGRIIAAALPPTQRAPYANPEFLNHLPPITQPEDLTDTPCILRQQESAAWSFESVAGKRQTVAPKVGLRVNTMELAHSAAQAGHGIAMLPLPLAQTAVETGALARLLPDWFADPVNLALLCRPARLSDPAVATVRRYILDACNTAA